MRGRHERLVSEARVLLAHLDALNRRWACEVPGCDGLPHDGWLHHHARANQREPLDYRLWLVLAGRGFGKTRTGAETVRSWCTGDPRHVAVIARSDREVRHVCFEGPAGLLTVVPPEYIRDYARGAGDARVTLTNGSILRAFSAEQPESIRGYAFDGAWCDEYAAWSPQTAQATMDNLWFALRESASPRVVVTTTPRRVAHVRALLRRAEAEGRVTLTRGRTLDNLANLSPDAIEDLVGRYGGTRLGRQELDGEMVEDVDGALWTWPMIEACRVDEAEQPWRVVVAVDPAVTSNEDSDETGIVVVGATGPRRRPDLWVLADYSGRYTPQGWARMAVDAYHRWEADAVVGEVNNGGDLVETVMRVEDRSVRFRPVRASRGKRTRAEPIAAMYEQGRVHHVGVLTVLEDQLTTWTVDSKDSPDRLDALVWGCTDLIGARTGFASVVA